MDWEGLGPYMAMRGRGLTRPRPQTHQGRPLVAVAEESFREQVLGILGTGRGLEQFLQLEQLCVSHAPPGSRPRPLPILRLYLSEVGHAHPVAVERPLPAEKATPTKQRPCRRKLRPLRFSPYNADGEGDRDRHRAHGQGGAHQGARGGKGGNPPPAAAADLQRQADER
ncbi:PREDICTED: uncharacterized protein LOC101814004 isoform X2 [Ficedula albicollis]|uniref:uncharacterized protein LOC101814004 isoform X2 n=1 Tax=Ficedula albicollis TaxID=59894 RepID=UPI0007AD7869|nr:PREDICTED: uncharacterized protein LOC101814004 isoform X2 [Ficedula albicollis]